MNKALNGINCVDEAVKSDGSCSDVLLFCGCSVTCSVTGSVTSTLSVTGTGSVSVTGSGSETLV